MARRPSARLDVERIIETCAICDLFRLFGAISEMNRVRTLVAGFGGPQRRVGLLNDAQTDRAHRAPIRTATVVDHQ